MVGFINDDGGSACDTVFQMRQQIREEDLENLQEHNLNVDHCEDSSWCEGHLPPMVPY